MTSKFPFWKVADGKKSDLDNQTDIDVPKVTSNFVRKAERFTITVSIPKTVRCIQASWSRVNAATLTFVGLPHIHRVAHMNVDLREGSHEILSHIRRKPKSRR